MATLQKDKRPMKVRNMCTRATLFGAALFLASCNSGPRSSTSYLRAEPNGQSHAPNPSSSTSDYLPAQANSGNGAGYGGGDTLFVKVKVAREMAIEILASVKEEQIPAGQKEIYDFYKAHRIAMIADLATTEFKERKHEEVFVTVDGEKKFREMMTEIKPKSTVWVADNIAGTDAELAAIILHELGHHAGIGVDADQEEFLNSYSLLVMQIYQGANSSEVASGSNTSANICADQQPSVYLKRLAGSWQGQLKFPDGVATPVDLVISEVGLLQFTIDAKSVTNHKAAIDALVNAEGKSKLYLQPQVSCTKEYGHTATLVQVTSKEDGTDRTIMLGNTDHTDLSENDTALNIHYVFSTGITGSHLFTLKKK